MKHKADKLAVSKESNVVNTHQIHIYYMNEKQKSANKRQGKKLHNKKKVAFPSNNVFRTERSNVLFPLRAAESASCFSIQ